MTERIPGFCHACRARRRAARSDHRRARDADLSDHVLSCSKASITPPRCSACRPSATSIRASAIRPPRCSKSASPRSKAAPRGLRWPPATPRRCWCSMPAAARRRVRGVEKLYGGSINQFNHAFKNFGWNVVWADPDDIGSFERAITPKTKAIFIESIANPGGIITDMEAVAQIAQARRRALHRRQHAGDALSVQADSSTAPTSSCIR